MLNVNTPDAVSNETPDAPVITVIVPKIGQVTINPYGLPVESDDGITNEQIAGISLPIWNFSEVPVMANVTVTGSVPAGSGVILTSTPPAIDSPRKEAFLYMEFQQLWDYDVQPAWNGVYSNAFNQVLVTSAGETKSNVLRLESWGEYYSYGAMRLFGSVSAYPSVPWQEGDGFQVNLAFTFTPAEVDITAANGVGGMDYDSAVILPASGLPAASEPMAVPEETIIPSEPAEAPAPESVPIQTPEAEPVPEIP